MNVSQKKHFSIVSFSGELAGPELKQASAGFSDLVAAGKKDIVLDFTNVPRIYSSEIALIVRLYKEVKKLRGILAIVNMNSNIEKVLYSVNLDKMIQIFSTMEEFEIENNLYELKLSVEEGLKITHEEMDNYLEVQLTGTIASMRDNRTLRQTLKEVKESHQNYLFDFSDMGFMDSQAVGIFVDFAQNISAKEGKIVIAQVNDIIGDLLRLLELENIFTIVSSVEDAQKILKH